MNISATNLILFDTHQELYCVNGGCKPWSLSDSGNNWDLEAAAGTHVYKSVLNGFKKYNFWLVTRVSPPTAVAFQTTRVRAPYIATLGVLFINIRGNNGLWLVKCHSYTPLIGHEKYRSSLIDSDLRVIFRGTFVQNMLNVSVLEVMKKTNIYLLPKLWFSLLFTLRS